MGGGEIYLQVSFFDVGKGYTPPPSLPPLLPLPLLSSASASASASASLSVTCCQMTVLSTGNPPVHISLQSQFCTGRPLLKFFYNNNNNKK